MEVLEGLGEEGLVAMVEGLGEEELVAMVEGLGEEGVAMVEAQAI